MNNLLRHMLALSEKSGKVQRADLQNGLRVSVWAKPEGVVLYLSREKNFPSASEWAIVTSNWPHPLDQAEYKRLRCYGRNYLVGRLFAAKPLEADND